MNRTTTAFEDVEDVQHAENVGGPWPDDFPANGMHKEAAHVLAMAIDKRWVQTIRAAAAGGMPLDGADAQEVEDPLATILRDYAGLEGLGRTGRVIRELVAEVRSARRERDEALAWKQAVIAEAVRLAEHDVAPMLIGDLQNAPAWSQAKSEQP